MKFKPCIDIHNGKVKQLVGGSLTEEGDQSRADENFISELGGDYYAEIYKTDGLKGGHVIMLNPPNSEFYEENCRQALNAIHTYPDGLQIGGGITADNASYFIEQGASHVIVTSYIFRDGQLHYDNLLKLVDAVGKEHIVIDLSCRKKDDGYYIVTDRWKKFTTQKISFDLLDELSQYCDEFLVHGVDVEGMSSGIEGDLVKLLGEWDGIPITYAGGVSSLSDLERMRTLGNNRVDVTVGSSLDLFGGELSYDKVVELCR